MLLGEAEILARLDEPGLVRLYDADVHEGRPFVVMEYVAGRTLEQRLKQGRPSFRETANLVAQLAHTLDRVHEHGVCHRDLKPSNVILDAAGRPRVLDFGLALLDQLWGGTERHEGEVSGTLGYIAPEQARGQVERIGARTDVFGLGAILYELLTGRPPYRGAGRDDLWAQARHCEITPPRQLDKRVSRPLERICLKALAADPEERYPTAGQLESALRQYLCRRWLGVGLIGVILLFAGTLGLWLLPRGLSDPLSGDLIIRVWSEGEGGKRGLRVDQPDSGALPVHDKEMIQMEVRLNRPGYAYLLWIDAAGRVDTYYPWNRHKDTIETPPPSQTPQESLLSPELRAQGWEVGPPCGLETILLLARTTPLPAEVKLAGVIGRMPATRLRHPQEFITRGYDRGRPTELAPYDSHRGGSSEAKQIDEPLLRLEERLRPHFEVIRYVRFAHQSD
jgi:serine/threonine protein kinase